MATTDYCFELEDTPENILAIKIKKQVLDKVVSATSQTEVKDILNKVITDNYESLGIEQLTLNENASIGPVLDSLVACALDESSEELLNTQITVADLLKSAVDLLCNPPTFDIPTPFPVIDISAEFWKQLLIALLRIALQIILSIIKKLISLILTLCDENFDWSGLNFTQALLDSIASGINDGIDYINDAFAAFGIDANGIAATSIINGEGCTPPANVDTTVIKSTTDFMNDLSTVLTPIEFCNFLEDVPSEQSFQVLEELMKFEYPQMAAVFNNRTKIRSLFRALGKRVDPKICQLIKDNAKQITSRPDLCFTGDAQDIRKGLLRERNLTEQQIEDLLQKERDRQKANLDKIADLLASTKTNPSKLLGPTPNIFCKGGTPGVVTMNEMPSLQQNLFRATDYVFNIFALTFMKELTTYQSALLSEQRTINTNNPVLTKFVTLPFVDQDGKLQIIQNTINPVFSQKIAQGIYSLCDEDGNTDNDSLADAYPGAVYGDNNDIDVDKVLSISNIDDLAKSPDDGGVEADNVYIINYNSKQKIAKELFNENFGLINEGSTTSFDVLSEGDKGGYTINGWRWLDDLISTDTSNMSININLPTKFVSIKELFNDTPNYGLIPSTDNLEIYTHGTGITLAVATDSVEGLDLTSVTGSIAEILASR